MPIYTLYAKIGRKNTKTAIHTIYEQPIDWPDLRETLLTTARKIHQDHDQTISEVTLERHLPGRYIRGTTSYRESRIRYRRQPEARFRVTYNPNMDTIKVECGAFGTPEAYAKYAEAYQTERGRKWKPPKNVPAGFEKTLLSGKIMYFDFLQLKTASYQATPHNNYGAKQEKTHQTSTYAGVYRGLYAGRNISTVEQEQIEKQNRH